MSWFNDLLSNPFFLTSLSSWFVAQVLKVIINAFINKKISLERLVGDGGMPSGHSATVSSLATIAGLQFGFGSFEFAMAATLAVIVCHDATGVRMETGKQAIIINEMLDTFERMKMGYSSDIVLKEFVGHTPLQVAAGITIGILNACFMHFMVFGG